MPRWPTKFRERARPRCRKNGPGAPPPGSAGERERKVLPGRARRKERSAPRRVMCEWRAAIANQASHLAMFVLGTQEPRLPSEKDSHICVGITAVTRSPKGGRVLATG